MKVKVVSINKQLFDGEAKAVILPTVNGKIEILDNHAHIFTLLSEGKVLIKTEKEDKEIEIKSGFGEFFENKLTLLVK